MEFKCDQCDLKYKSKNKLNHHHAAKHQMIRYKCEQCDLKYTQTQGLHMHVRDKHNGEKLSCDSCDFQTGVASGKQQMAAHRRLKHGEQKLKCGMCDFETYHASMLWDHKKRIHDGTEKKGLIATNVIIAVATDTILIIIQDKCTIQGKTWSNVINVCIKQLRSPI